MLKIKDNVDLKELEEFGFEENEYFYVKLEYAFDIEASRIVILKDTRELWLMQILSDTQEGVLFDLIQAGLVEKVYE